MFTVKPATHANKTALRMNGPSGENLVRHICTSTLSPAGPPPALRFRTRSSTMMRQNIKWLTGIFGFRRTPVRSEIVRREEVWRTGLERARYSRRMGSGVARYIGLKSRPPWRRTRNCCSPARATERRQVLRRLSWHPSEMTAEIPHFTVHTFKVLFTSSTAANRKSSSEPRAAMPKAPPCMAESTESAATKWPDRVNSISSLG